MSGRTLAILADSFRSFIQPLRVTRLVPRINKILSSHCGEHHYLLGYDAA
jgi:hypothetical protein